MSLHKKLGPYSAFVFTSPQKTGKGLADDLIKNTRKVINEKGRCIWALSGGSSILKLYDALKDEKDTISDVWSNLFVCWVDERHVPHKNEESNFGKAYRYFWKEIVEVTLIPVPYLETVDESADAYETELEKHGIDYANPVDIILLGMGADGHTASLFPNDEALDEEDKEITNSKAPKTNQDRITMTYKLINSSKNKMVLAYGREKGSIFNDPIELKNYKKYPIYNIEKEGTTFYVDQQFVKVIKE